MIKGKVDHSIVARNCYVSPNARIKNSILSPKVTIGEGASVEYAIIDKSVTVQAGITIRGTEEEPIVVSKGSCVVEDMVK